MPKINIQTPTARARLAPQGKPYKVRLLPGVWLGYRAAQSGTGSWIVIASNGRSGYWTNAFAHADDKQKPDGVAVFTYEQPRTRPAPSRAARQRCGRSSGDHRRSAGRLRGRSHRPWAPRLQRDARAHSPARPFVGAAPLDSHQQAASSLARRSDPNRHGAGDRQPRHEGGPRRVRARGASRRPCRRQCAGVARRARNAAQRSRGARRGPEQPAGQSVVAAAYDVDEAFGLFVQAHAETGSRSSQLARCKVADLLGEKLMVPASRKGRNGGRGGHVGIPLAPSLSARLKQAAAGRPPDAPLLLKEDGSPWQDGDHKRPFAKAARAAGLPADTTIYSLRHSSIARMLLRGLPIRLVASLHDTSTPIIEQHYGQFVDRHGDDLVRAALIDTTPTEPAGNIAPFLRRTKP